MASSNDSGNSFEDLVSGISRNAFSEFIVEFLGGLVPGVTFLVFFCLGCIVPLYAVVAMFTPTLIVSSFCRAEQIPVSTGVLFLGSLLTLVGFLFIAYIAGHLFYRQDPKHADRASFNAIPRYEHYDGMVRPHDGIVRVEYPYYHLKHYLRDRGLHYLADRVPWDPETDGMKKSLNSSGYPIHPRRCKHWLNAIKIRVFLASPRSSKTLARNEAHIRLSSTMWYVCRSLIASSAVGVLVYVVAAIVHRIRCDSWSMTPEIVIMPLAIVSLAWLAILGIEKSLHYQREREVLFILETAHWLAENQIAPKLFEGLDGRGGGVVKSP